MQRSSRLLALNDPRLAAFLGAADEASRERELANVLANEVAPLVRTILSHYARAEWPIQRADAEDIAGQVNVRLIRKLNAALILDEEHVQNLEAYVVTLTRNAVRDLMRRNSPQRSRLRSRFRYLFTHDKRLAIWDQNGVTVCGLAGWSGEPMPFERLARPVSPLIRDQRKPAEGVVHLLESAREPLRLSDVVSFFMDAWGISDEPASDAVEPATSATAEQQVASRQYLGILWEEIAALPDRQRAALLLNLREPDSGNAVLLFVVLGIADLDTIAAAIGISREELQALWDQLPLDDLTIAARLGITRQQVINSRRSARERLSRRISAILNVYKS